jgi:hypothetical protein
MLRRKRIHNVLMDERRVGMRQRIEGEFVVEVLIRFHRCSAAADSEFTSKEIEDLPLWPPKSLANCSQTMENAMVQKILKSTQLYGRSGRRTQEPITV